MAYHFCVFADSVTLSRLKVEKERLLFSAHQHRASRVSDRILRGAL